MTSQITLRQAISAYVDEAHAERLSPHTIADYRNSFAHLAKIVPLDAPISSVTPAQIIRLLSSLADPALPPPHRSETSAQHPHRPVGAVDLGGQARLCASQRRA